MKQALLKEPKEIKEKVKVFSGISGRDEVDSTSLHKGMNLSSRCHPYLSTRLPREKVGKLPGEGKINGILKEQTKPNSVGNLIFVRGTSFYYKGVLINPNPVLGKSLTDGEKVLLDFDGKIFIFPDCLYFDYTSGGSEGLKKMDHELMLHFASIGGSAVDNVMYFTANKNLMDDDKREAYTKTFMEMKTGNWVTIRNTGDVRGVQTMKTVEQQEYRYALDSDWTKAEIIRMEETSGTLQMRLSIGKKDGTPATFTAPDSGYIHLYRHIPQMDHIFATNNRLWGAKGTRLYVSAEGNPLNFNQFEDREGDSFTKNLADRGGKIVAFATLNGKVVVLKESTMYQIYGSDATEYYVPYTIDKGCIDKESVVNLDGKIYFLSADGVYSFDGNKVKKTGLERTFQSGFAGTDGSRYFLLGTTRKGERELWVYDSESGEWYMEETDSFLSFVRIGEELCALKEDGELVRFGSGEERFSWEMETKPITAGINGPKRPGEVFLRVKGARNTSAALWAKTNREREYRLVANILFDGKEERSGHLCRLREDAVETLCVPLNALPCDNVTFKVRGKGEFTLYELETGFFVQK